MDNSNVNVVLLSDVDARVARERKQERNSIMTGAILGGLFMAVAVLVVANVVASTNENIREIEANSEVMA